jgi:hypothetical protein
MKPVYFLGLFLTLTSEAFTENLIPQLSTTDHLNLRNLY